MIAVVLVAIYFPLNSWFNASLRNEYQTYHNIATLSEVSNESDFDTVSKLLTNLSPIDSERLPDTGTETDNSVDYYVCDGEFDIVLAFRKGELIEHDNNAFATMFKMRNAPKYPKPSLWLRFGILPYYAGILAVLVIASCCKSTKSRDNK